MTFRIVKSEQDKIDELNSNLAIARAEVVDLSADKRRLLESNKEKDQAILSLEVQVRTTFLRHDCFPFPGFSSVLSFLLRSSSK